ncbi:hypothetical protein BUALT_Bualt18G0043000 [Buddleja alternifolia]|uniref:Uncharacterized protein n=1 Tax=Buddleja alternifolia TaxID=168488 RepID=A0AAV6W3T1_9LAMI|nr:hypothetical protein BUALT_Bualt18G0043000 [Buddleja alternifolia]
MAKLVALVSTLCILATFVHGHNQEIFNVEGDVYCDPCRVEFETQLSERLTGATVKLECRNRETSAVTYSVEGVTGINGHYSLKVEGDHENDICDVTLLKSPREDCNEQMEDLEKARVSCTKNTGITSHVRFANPIGFMTKYVNPKCAPVLFDLGFQLE